MVTTVLPVKRGLSSPAVTSIPKEWDQQWFRYFIDNFLTNADIRNVAAGSGIVVSGNVSGNSTVGAPNTTVTISQSPIATNTVLGNISGVTAVPVAVSQAQLTALINLFTSSLSGTVPASGGGAVNFLRADGTWNIPSGSAAIPNNTVLGNVSGGSAIAIALTQTQLTTLVNTFTSLLSGAVPASGGGTVNFLRADGTFAVPPVPVGANPTASVGTAAVPGVALTFLRSDGAPAISQAIVPTWSGIHTFNARPAFTAGATVSGGTFISRGITDNGLTTGLTIAATQAISTTAPSAGNISLTVNGATTAVALSVISALGAGTAGADINILRNGSVANTVLKGAALDLADNTATTATALQHSGGQFEVWMTQNNGVLWSQAFKVLTTNGVVINAPTTGPALSLSGQANQNSLEVIASTTAGQSFGLVMTAGTNSTDYAARILNAAATTEYFKIRGDGETFVAPNGTLLFTLAALTNNAGAGAGTLTNAPAAGNPTKWIKINDNGTVRSIPAW